MPADMEQFKDRKRPHGLPFRIAKIGHVVLNVSDMKRAVDFYTNVLGFSVSDIYPENMVPGGMVFMRCNADHHGVALVGSMKEQSPNIELNHFAFEVGTLDEVLRARDHLKKRKVPIDFEGRRRAGCQIAVEFRDPENEGKTKPGRLIFVSPKKTRYLFATDRAGKEILQCSRAEIGRRFLMGQAVKLDGPPEESLFDRIMGGLLGKLRLPGRTPLFAQ